MFVLLRYPVLPLLIRLPKGLHKGTLKDSLPASLSGPISGGMTVGVLAKQEEIPEHYSEPIGPGGCLRWHVL